MTLTESEAREKWCPFSRDGVESAPSYNRLDDGGPPHNCKCLASRCMAWRWAGESQPLRLQGKDVMPRGYCGLAGKGGPT